jgi:hypothetical protein
MSKSLNTNFHVKAPVPIDSRMRVELFVDLDAIPIKYDHMVTHVRATDTDWKYYLNTNTWVEVTTSNIPEWSTIIGDITTQIDLMAYFDLYALVGHTHPPITPEPHTHVESDITDLDKYTQEEVDALTKYKSSFITGLIYNGTASVTLGDNTTFDIIAGIGIKTIWSSTDPFAPPVSYPVAYGPFLAVTPTYLATDPASYIGILYDHLLDTSAIVQSNVPFTNTAKRTIITVGIVEHTNNATINNVSNEPVPTVRMGNHLSDLASSIGALNLYGNTYTPNGVNLTINKSIGSIYKLGVSYDALETDPSTKTFVASIATIFRYRLQDSTEYSNATTLDAEFYDLAGVRTAVTAGKWTIPRIYILTSGETRILYGQTLYDSYVDALSAIETEEFITESHAEYNGVLRAYVILKQGVTDLTDTTKAVFVKVDKWGWAAKPLQEIIEDKHYTHTQGSASTSWVIPHLMNKRPSVSVFDASGNNVSGQIAHTDVNNLTITFNTAFSGVAYLN